VHAVYGPQQGTLAATRGTHDGSNAVSLHRSGNTIHGILPGFIGNREILYLQYIIVLGGVVHQVQMYLCFDATLRARRFIDSTNTIRNSEALQTRLTMFGSL